MTTTGLDGSPGDPGARAVVAGLRGSPGLRARRGWSRRQLLSAGAAVALTGPLAACGAGGAGANGSGARGAEGLAGGAGSGGGPASSGGIVPAKDLSDVQRTVAWSNWAAYLDRDGRSSDSATLAAFTKRSGIAVSYTEDIEDNDSYVSSHLSDLSHGRGFGRDLMVMTDWMAAKLVRSGWVQELDRALLPNARNLRADLEDVDYDPGRRFSLPWQSGYAGLAWHTQRLKELTGRTELRSIKDLWDPRLKGRVEVLTEMRDTMGLMLRADGVDITKPFSREKFETAVSVLETMMSNGQIRQAKGATYKDDLASGDAVASLAWSGDISQLNIEAGHLPGTGGPYRFAFPDSGAVYFSDNFVVPMGATHRNNALMLINHYYQPKVAAQVAKFINYICPVQGAKEELSRLGVDRRMLESIFLFPDGATLARTQTFRSLDDVEEEAFTSLFRHVLGI